MNHSEAVSQASQQILTSLEALKTQLLASTAQLVETQVTGTTTGLSGDLSSNLVSLKSEILDQVNQLVESKILTLSGDLTNNLDTSLIALKTQLLSEVNQFIESKVSSSDSTLSGQIINSLTGLKTQLVSDSNQLVNTQVLNTSGDLTNTLGSLAQAVQIPEVVSPSSPDEPVLDTIPAIRLMHHSAPKLAIQMQNNCPHQSPNLAQEWARVPLYDLIVMDAEVVRNAPDLLGPTGTIRTSNPNAVILHYMSAGDAHEPQNLADVLWEINHEVMAGVTESMYAHNAQGQRLNWFQLAGNEWTRLMNNFFDFMAPQPANFDYMSVWPFYLAAKMNELVLNTPYSDGMFYDWMTRDVSWKYPGQIDATGDHVADANSTVDYLFRQGIKLCLGSTRFIANMMGNGNKLVMGNAGWNTESTYASLVNGAMFEQFLAGDTGTSYNGYNCWATIMKSYILFTSANVQPRTSYISYAGDDLKTARFSLCSALLGDGYFHWTNSGAYTEARWLDEYSVNVETGVATPWEMANKGYLGPPLDIARSCTNPNTSFPDTLVLSGNTAGTTPWFRDYVGGRVLLNPHKTSSFTVTLPKPFRRIQGSTPDNPGGTVTSVTLAPRTGLVVLSI